MFKSNKGFTLVELIVVIAILAILAGIAIPAYSGYIKKAQDAKVVTELDAIQTAAQAANATAGEIGKIEVTKTTIIVTGKETKDAEGTVTTAALAKNYGTDFVLFYDEVTRADEATEVPSTETFTFKTALELAGTSYENGATWYAADPDTTGPLTAGWNK